MPGVSSIFDELLDRAIREYVLAYRDAEDRNRERCDTGRPHSPTGRAIDIALFGCKCQRNLAPKEFLGLQGVIDATAEPLTAELLWYGPYGGEPRDRRAKLTDITEA